MLTCSLDGLCGFRTRVKLADREGKSPGAILERGGRGSPCHPATYLMPGPPDCFRDSPVEGWVVYEVHRMDKSNGLMGGNAGDMRRIDV